MSPFASQKSPGWCRNFCKEFMGSVGTLIANALSNTPSLKHGNSSNFSDCEHLPPARYYMSKCTQVVYFMELNLEKREFGSSAGLVSPSCPGVDPTVSSMVPTQMFIDVNALKISFFER